MSAREAIRLRPALYFGSLNQDALHHMVFEVLDSCLNEVFAGNCNEITVTLRDDNEVCVHDNSAGLPIEKEQDIGVSKLELLMTRSMVRRHDFSDVPPPYTVFGGLHGIGLFAVNALSSICAVESARSGQLWRQTYAAGEATSAVERVRTLEPNEHTGVTICFKPDFTILQPNSLDFDVLARRCYEVAHLLSGIRITLCDERRLPSHEVTYSAEDGLNCFLKDQTLGAKFLHEPIHARFDLTALSSWYRRREVRVEGEFAFVFTDSQNVFEQCFVNTVQTLEDSTHNRAVRSGIMRSLNLLSQNKFGEYLKWRHLSPGLVSVVSLLHPDPVFTSIGEIRLEHRKLFRPLSNIVAQTFNGYLAEHPSESELLLAQCLTRKRVEFQG